MPESVAMNGWMFIRVTMKPLTAPTASARGQAPEQAGNKAIGRQQRRDDAGERRRRPDREIDAGAP